MAERDGPRVIVVVSGKRKSGKDYVTERLRNRLGVERSSVLRLSAPLKSQYSIEHGLDFDRLLDSSDYKEKCRADMIRWGEERRLNDPGYFIRFIAKGPGSERDIWIISDARRRSDLNYFQEQYPGQVLAVRIEASEKTRTRRGWIFTEGIDDAPSECDLDSSDFDVIVQNDDGDDGDDKEERTRQRLDEQLSDLELLINRRLLAGGLTDGY